MMTTDGELKDLLRIRTSATTLLYSQRGRYCLVNAGGIMDLWVQEARIFKYGGSGVGTNLTHSW